MRILDNKQWQQQTFGTWRGRGIADISAILNMPPPLTERTFSRQMKAVLPQQKLWHRMKWQSVLLVWGTNDGRGFIHHYRYQLPSSKHWHCLVISADTGMVLDGHVPSRVCKECKQHKGKISGVPWVDWLGGTPPTAMVGPRTQRPQCNDPLFLAIRLRVHMPFKNLQFWIFEFLS